MPALHQSHPLPSDRRLLYRPETQVLHEFESAYLPPGQVLQAFALAPEIFPAWQPEHPVYVIQSEAHYSVLWLASDAPPELDVADTFDVLYFDQLAEAEHPTRLTLRHGHSPPSHPPPLESVLLTRWPAAAVVDWNGAEPLL